MEMNHQYSKSESVASTFNDSKLMENPRMEANTIRNADHIAEMTQNFIQVVEKSTEVKRYGVRVEDLLSKFKSEQK